MLYFDTNGFVRIGILASLLHEAGHVLVWLIYTRSAPVLRLSLGGIGLDIQGNQLSKKQLLILAAAGPFTNFVCFAAAFAVLQHSASYWGYFFAGANLAIGLFNLIPLGSLDGRRILQALTGS